MNKLLPFTLLFLFASCQEHKAPASQNQGIDHAAIKEDLDEILSDLSNSYVYLADKKVNLECIREHYEKRIPEIQTEEETVLFFEYLLDEFYDNHVMLNTNRNSSYRLYSPIYLKLEGERIVVSSVWQSQLEPLHNNIVGAELMDFNGLKPEELIAQFPTHCQDKSLPEVKEWIINKAIAGRYNESRILGLKLVDGQTLQLNMDKLKVMENKGLLSSYTVDSIAVIRLNNSLGMNALIPAFDEAIDNLPANQGLILDLRNTVDGGNSYVARAIMGRFIDRIQAYQTHQMPEQYDDGPIIPRIWTEQVNPRGITYQRPIVVLVGRWTGSMGEGLAIGLDGMKRAHIIGSEMERLAGEMSGFSFKHQSFGYRLSTARLFHLNGTAREEYLPTHYVAQTTNKRDQVLEQALETLKKLVQEP